MQIELLETKLKILIYFLDDCWGQEKEEIHFTTNVTNLHCSAVCVLQVCFSFVWHVQYTLHSLNSLMCTINHAFMWQQFSYFNVFFSLWWSVMKSCGWLIFWKFAILPNVILLIWKFQVLVYFGWVIGYCWSSNPLKKFAWLFSYDMFSHFIGSYLLLSCDGHGECSSSVYFSLFTQTELQWSCICNIAECVWNQAFCWLDKKVCAIIMARWNSYIVEPFICQFCHRLTLIQNWNTNDVLTCDRISSS